MTAAITPLLNLTACYPQPPNNPRAFAREWWSANDGSRMFVSWPPVLLVCVRRCG